MARTVLGRRYARKYNRPGGYPGHAGYDPTLNEYFSEWIRRKQKTARKPVTPYRYNLIYQKHFSDSLGTKRIAAVTRRDILEFQTLQLEKVSPKTVNYQISLLTHILSDAVADEIITKNPAGSIKPLQISRKTSKSNHRALTDAEQKRFIRAARGDYYYEFFAFLLLTGLRHGEAAALTWKDIDYEKNMIHIRSTLTFDLNGHVVRGAPKSEAGERDIPMTAGIRRILEKQKKKTPDLRKETIPEDHELVFPSSTGRIMSNAAANQAICRILGKLEKKGAPIEHFSCHAFRNTFATRFIEQGGNPQTLKTLLGHASLAMTMDLYSHVLPNTKQKEMDMLRIDV